MINPYTFYHSLAELEAALGFSLPVLPNEPIVSYISIEDKMGDIRYGEKGRERYSFRQATLATRAEFSNASAPGIAGIYYNTLHSTHAHQNRTISCYVYRTGLYGHEDMAFAIWEDARYAYSLVFHCKHIQQDDEAITILLAQVVKLIENRP